MAKRREKPKPCPFCGKAPREGKNAYGYFILECDNYSEGDDMCTTNPSTMGHRIAKSAVAAWNKRKV